MRAKRQVISVKVGSNLYLHIKNQKVIYYCIHTSRGCFVCNVKMPVKHMTYNKHQLDVKFFTSLLNLIAISLIAKEKKIRCCPLSPCKKRKVKKQQKRKQDFSRKNKVLYEVLKQIHHRTYTRNHSTCIQCFYYQTFFSLYLVLCPFHLFQTVIPQVVLDYIEQNPSVVPDTLGIHSSSLS